MIPEEIKQKQEVLSQLFSKHKVKEAYLFGSAVTEKFNKKSDLDILVNLFQDIDPVEAGGHLWDLEEEIENLFKRKVDLITNRSIKNPYFMKELEQTKVRIYG